MKALADLDVPNKNLVKNMKHLEMLEVHKSDKPQTMTLAAAERRKSGCLQSLDMVSFPFLYSSKIFYFLI